MKNLLTRTLTVAFLTGFLVLAAFSLNHLLVARAESGAQTLMQPPLSVTKTVCASGCDYASLTAAIADVQANGLSGALTLELAASYTSAGETFPLNFTNLTGASQTNTLTVRPASGASGLSITSADAVATVNLDNAQFVTFDGRPGGTGTAKQLTIENTNTTGNALRFINEASNNTIKYIAFKGVTRHPSRGVVAFGTTTGANGNDNNTIDNCDIGDGATTPTLGIYSNGSTGTIAQNNSGNTVSNSNIFNFYAPDAEAAGVWLNFGSTDWTVSGNSFYQTATRAAVVQMHRAIHINTIGTGNNFTVTGNFIGGSEPNAGGTAWTTTGTAERYLFTGIMLNVGTTTPSSVQGNTIKNFVWTTSGNVSVLPGIWSGFYVEAGSVNIGTTAGNTIGGATGTGSISVMTSGLGGKTFGIGSSSSGTVNISNNNIGSMTTNGTSASIGAPLTGIHVTGGTNTISNNTVGSTTEPNSLNAATSSTYDNGVQLVGIFASGASSTITNNTVANLNNNYAGTSVNGQIRGINTGAGQNIITGNTVRNLSTTSLNAGTTTTASILGIIQTSTTAGQTISRNTVHSLSNTAATAAVSVTGIYHAGAASGTNTIARNFVHSLAVSSSSASSVINGVQFVAGTFTAQNNMVRVGLDTSGASTASASTVRGIYDNGTTAGRNFYYNSVYLGGTQTSGAANTYAFLSTGVSNARTYQNNIFVNARANGGGTGKHYAAQYGGTSATQAGLTSNSNIFFVSGAGGVLGFYASADRATLAAWQTATGQDGASAFVDPKFKNPTGDAGSDPATAVDLHLQTANPAESSGIFIASVADDFDGEIRANFTPTDIGADAGSFTLSPDVFAPAIKYTALSAGSTANRTLTGFATITDNSGAVAGGANRPRLYFKKSTDNDVFGVPNDVSGNGWKYVAATNSSSPYDFTIDYSIINGGSVAPGDTIQYFVVAQDAANNLGSSPAGATASANPPVQNVNAHGAVNSYSILGTLSGGTKTVCASGCDYASLTKAGGIFADINAKVVTGNIVINITGDLTEDGANALNQWTEEGAGNYMLTIQPADGTMKTVSGNAAAGMIRLNGADRVTIDGRFDNAGRFLTFRNTSTSNPAIYLFNDASNNTVRNSIVEGASTGNGVIILTTGATTGNDNNTITENQIRDLSTTAGVPFSLIVSQGTSATVSNSNNTVSNNELFNFTAAAVQINPNSDSFTVTGNTIYQTAPRTTTLYGILGTGEGTNTFSGNTIRDLNTSGIAYGIRLLSASDTTVSRNRIYSFPSTSGATNAQYGIFANQSSGSTATIVNNQITVAPSFANAQDIYGIYDANQSGATTNVYYNSVLVGGTASSANSSWAYVRTSASTATLRNNIFFNDRTSGTSNHFAAGNQTASGTFSSNYNLFVGTGATTAANFFDFGTTATGTPVSFSTWKTSTGDANSQAGNPDSTFSTSLFVDPTVGDLHINKNAGASTLALVSNVGTPVTGITNDYDNDTRGASTPDIGSDEFGASNTAPSITAATGLSRHQGSPASNSQIAVVSDAETAAGSLIVTATTVPTGITISNIVNTGGTVTADIAADYAAVAGDNTVVLTVTDADNASTTANLIINVAANTAPTINAATGVTRAQGGLSSNSQIATVSDADQSEETLVVTVNGGASATVNGVTISNILVNSAGSVTADIAADGTATDANFTSRVTDAQGAFVETTLTVTVAVGGYEADVAPRPNGTGNGTVNSGDVTQIQRFAVGLDQPYQAGEFQRADSAPRLDTDNTTLLLGNGKVNSGDVTQAQRYSVGLDKNLDGTVPAAGGPAAPLANPLNETADEAQDVNSSFEQDAAVQAVYEVRAIRESLTATTLTVAIRLDTDAAAATQAASVGGTLRFNPSQLSNPTNVRLGSGAPAGTSFFTNTSDVANGRLGITINAPVNQTFAVGKQNLLLIDFTVTGAGATILSFDNSQAQKFVGDVQGNELTNTEFPPTETSLSPTSALVSVSGKVIFPDEKAANEFSSRSRATTRARVWYTDALGQTRSVQTNERGYFRFEAVEAGYTYLFEAEAKGRRFAPQVVTVNETIENLNIISAP